MSASANPDIVTENLVFCLDKADPKVDYYDDPVERAQGLVSNSSSSSYQIIYNHTEVSDFLADYSQLTVMVWLTKNSYHTNYSQNTIYRWYGSGQGLGNASLNLYHFGDYNGNGDDGRFGWYAGLGGSWSGSSSTTLEVGETALLTFQYTTSVGMRAWKNGSPLGGRNNSGKGDGGYQNTGGQLGIYTGSESNVHSKAHQVLMYDRDLSDAEILQNYNATKSRFGL